MYGISHILSSHADLTWLDSNWSNPMSGQIGSDYLVRLKIASPSQ